MAARIPLDLSSGCPDSKDSEWWLLCSLPRNLSSQPWLPASQELPAPGLTAEAFNSLIGRERCACFGAGLHAVRDAIHTWQLRGPILIVPGPRVRMASGVDDDGCVHADGRPTQVPGRVVLPCVPGAAWAARVREQCGCSCAVVLCATAHSPASCCVTVKLLLCPLAFWSLSPLLH